MHVINSADAPMHPRALHLAMTARKQGSSLPCTSLQQTVSLRPAPAARPVPQVAAVLKEAGQRVEEDEPILQIETDKVTVDVRAPRAGVLETILVGSHPCSCGVLSIHLISSIQHSLCQSSRRALLADQLLAGVGVGVVGVGVWCSTWRG